VEVSKVLQYWISQLKAKNEAKKEFYSKTIYCISQSKAKKGSQTMIPNSSCFLNNLSQGLTKQN
jgi:hypothetical protein